MTANCIPDLVADFLCGCRDQLRAAALAARCPEQDIDDVLQTTFVKVSQAFAAKDLSEVERLLTNPGPMYAFLRTTVVHQVSDHYRRNRKATLLGDHIDGERMPIADTLSDGKLSQLQKLIRVQETGIAVNKFGQLYAHIKAVSKRSNREFLDLFETTNCSAEDPDSERFVKLVGYLFHLIPFDERSAMSQKMLGARSAPASRKAMDDRCRAMRRLLDELIKLAFGRSPVSGRKVWRPMIAG